MTSISLKSKKDQKSNKNEIAYRFFVRSSMGDERTAEREIRPTAEIESKSEASWTDGRLR